MKSAGKLEIESEENVLSNELKFTWWRLRTCVVVRLLD